MAAFIVISADNRLHHIVDGIEKCRPLNHDIVVNLSTGKIIDDNGNLTYQYSITSGVSSKGEKKNFSDLLANQLAHFRLHSHIADNEMVNIFILENPLNADDLEKGRWWQEEIKKIYESGHDKGFRLFRVLFSYDINKSEDVVNQVPVEHLRNVLLENDEINSSFQSYIFYIDNQKCDAAALCTDTKDHDLKLPRMLCDFMMLISNAKDSYRVFQAIRNDKLNKVFSVGYAESMYYFADVQQYFLHADTYNLHEKMLQDDDETSSEMKDKERMLFEKYPFGLLKRERTMRPKYKDVPFSEDINDYPESVDKIIDDCIVSLQKVIEAERKYELDIYLLPLRNKRNSIQKELKILVQLPQEQRDDTYENKIKEKEHELKETDNLIERKKNSFIPLCPEYLSRNEIYTHAIIIDDDEKRNEYVESAKTHYNKLVEYLKGRSFQDFLKNQDTLTVKATQSNDAEPSKKDIEKTKRSGCLTKLMFWRKEPKQQADSSDDVSSPEVASIAPNFADERIKRIIDNISKPLLLKNQYKDFCIELNDFEEKIKKEASYIRDFKLTNHTSHYYHLINLEKLKHFQKEHSVQRLETMIKEWRNENTPDHQSISSIENWIIKKSKAYTSQFQYISWDNPFPFINCPTLESIVNIINELNILSAPCAHYYQITDTAPNIISKIVYSDLPQFSSLFEQAKGNVSGADYINAIESKHIASKICFMQFLPMDEEIIKNLTDLKCQEVTD